MFTLNVKRIAAGGIFAVLALTAGATANDANAKKWKDHYRGYHCDDWYRCETGYGGVYHRRLDGIDYYYGGTGLGFRNELRYPYYNNFDYDHYYDNYDAPYYQQHSSAVGPSGVQLKQLPRWRHH